MLTPFSSPAMLLASSLFSDAGKLVNALFDDTFTDIYRLQPFDYAILMPYFAVLIVLSFYGLHRYEMIRGYLKHRKQMPAKAPQKFDAAAARDHSAARFTTSDTWSSGCWKKPARSIIRATCCKFRCWTIPPTRPHPFTRALVARVSGVGSADRIHPSDESARLQGRRAAKRSEDRYRRDRRDFRRRFRSAGRFPAAHRALFRRSEGRHGADALGVSEPPLQRADRSAGDAARRPLCAGARGALRRRTVLQLQRHGRNSAAVDDRRCGRLAARHADRGFRSELSRAAEGLEVRLRAVDRVPVGTAGRDLRLPGAAIALGQGLDAGRHEAAADDSAVGCCRGA